MQFNYNVYGKLKLKNDPIQFNISHTRKIVLIAFCQSSAIGVDVETVQRSIDISALSQRLLSPVEIAHLSTLTKEQQQKTFIQYWTRKESLLKVIDTGFNNTYSQQLVTSDAHVEILPDIKDQYGKTWQLFDLPFIDNHYSALAIEKIKKMQC